MVEVPAAEQSHSVKTLIKEFTERHLRKRRRRPEYAERILGKELTDWAHRDARTIQPREVIQLLVAEKPRNYISVLARIQRLVELAVEERTVRVESAADLSKCHVNTLCSTLLRSSSGPLSTAASETSPAASSRSCTTTVPSTPFAKASAG